MLGKKNSVHITTYYLIPIDQSFMSKLFNCFLDDSTDAIEQPELFLAPSEFRIRKVKRIYELSFTPGPSSRKNKYRGNLATAQVPQAPYFCMSGTQSKSSGIDDV